MDDIAIVVLLVVVLLLWWLTMRAVRRTPDAAFVDMREGRSTWQVRLVRMGPLAPLVYWFRLRPQLRAALSRPPKTQPGWYPDQRDPEVQRWWNGRRWTDIVR